METPFTPRNVVKYAVKALVYHRAAKLTKTAITDHTQFEKDDFIVDLSSNVIGWGVSAKLKPYTDKMVDKTADFIAEQRDRRKAKKNTTE